MVEIIEGSEEKGLKCSFPDSWHAIKYDESSWHRKQMKSQLKAMDILATEGNRHWWVEIKDCAGYEDDNRPRLSPNDCNEVIQTRQWVDDRDWSHQVKVSRKKPFIVDEIVEKFRQTLMALSFAEREQNKDLADYWLICSRKPLSIVLLLTWDSPDFNRLAMRLQDKLKNMLSCYGVEAFVINGTAPVTMGLEMTVERIQP
ncbi:hypothetical protein [Thiolapillus sp.]|uniref:hypothetical protein n=1 Tax=Thiolapillus sp. TaxID=2017437 RepID=UPI003AF86587